MPANNNRWSTGGALLMLASSPVNSDLTSSDESDLDSDVELLPPSPPAANQRPRALPLGISPPLTNSSVASRDSYFTGTFLDQALPRSTAIRAAIPVQATDAWSLALVDEADQRVLYAQGAAGFAAFNLRENVVDLLDLADERLQCDRVVVVLNKADDDLALMLHSLLYVGGVVLSPKDASVHGRPSSKFVQVGIDL